MLSEGQGRVPVLIVSHGDRLEAMVKGLFTGFVTMESCNNAAKARQQILERYFDIIIIDSPIPDESGEALSLFIMEQTDASVLFIVPQAIYEDVSDSVTPMGVLVVSKPVSRGQLKKSIGFLSSVQARFGRLQKKLLKSEEKLEELKIVSRAKIVLMERKHMTEDEAHRYIGKQAMDGGISRRRAAEEILEDE